MRVGIYWSQESWGGVDTHLYQLLKNWPHPEDEIVIFYNHNNQGFPRVYSEVQKIKNVSFVKFNSLSYTTFMENFQTSRFYLLFRVLFYFLLPLFYIFQLIQANSLFKRYPINCLISNNGGYPAAWGCLAAIQAAHWQRVPQRILLVHHNANAPSKFRSWFDRWVDRKMAKTVTHLVTVSKATFETIQQERDPALALVPHSVIYNGIDLLTPERKSRTTWPFSESLKMPLWLGIVGRIEIHKGHEDLLRALLLLSSEELEKVGVVIVGKGEPDYIVHLKAMVKTLGLEKNIMWTGYSEVRPQVLMNYFDAVVVATRDFEGFGLTLAESMSVAKPVIATSVGAIPEFVTDGRVGALVKPMDPRGLASAIKNLINDPDEWQQKGLRARVDIEKFSGKNMGLAFEKLLERNRG